VVPFLPALELGFGGVRPDDRVAGCLGHQLAVGLAW
jgi:hypothetical protein